MVQSTVPLQPAPFQPLNEEPVDGVARRVIVLPRAKPNVQVLPQLIPPVVLVTVPLPFVVTVSNA